MVYRKFILIFFSVLLGCNPSPSKSESDQENQADKVLIIQDIESFTQEDLSLYCDYIEDPTGLLGFEEVKSEATTWQRIPKHKVNFGFNDSYFWIRFSIHNKSEKLFQSIFEISFSRQDYIEVYFPDKENGFKKYITGDTFPYSQREIKNLGFAFELNQESNTKQTYYLRTRSTYNGSIINPNLFSLNKFQEWVSIRNLVNGIIYGLSGIMLLYNFFLYLTIRERVYLYVSASTFFFCIFLMGFHGTSFQFFYPNNPWLQNHDLIIFPNLTMIFMLLYTNEYLELERNAPRMRLVNKYIISIFVLMPFVFLFTIKSNPVFTFRALALIGVSSFIFEIIVGVYLCIKRYRPAYYYVASFISFFIGTITFLVTVTFILIPNVFIYWSFQVGYSFMLILLALGLADKINYLKNNLKEANSSLEIKVEKRTEELSQALKSIRSDLNTAKKIQTNTLPRKINFHDSLSVEVKYLPMEEVGGDFYDIIQLNENVIRIFLADATGHGVQGALMTMTINSEYQNTKSFPLSPGEVLTILNQQYCHRYFYLNAYFTCVLMDIDLEKNKIYYAAGGHPDQFLFRTSSLNILSSTGKLMGVTKDAEFKTLEFDFADNDRILLFTDGIFEEFNENREEFGEDRFSEVSLANRKLPNDKYLEKILDIVFAYLGKNSQQDDITLLAIERKN
ncbi:MAG: SpoIIE family protein phosphatase [Leptospiraceae bacterium]|nr:SpoIIE family protein phosphatase [Leptospiraceae bacterium]